MARSGWLFGPWLHGFFVGCTVWWKFYMAICKEQPPAIKGRETRGEDIKNMLRLRHYFNANSPNYGIAMNVAYGYGEWRFCKLPARLMVFNRDMTVLTDFYQDSNGWFREKREDEPDKKRKCTIIWSFVAQRVCTTPTHQPQNKPSDVYTSRVGRGCHRQTTVCPGL